MTAVPGNARTAIPVLLLLLPSSCGGQRPLARKPAAAAAAAAPARFQSKRFGYSWTLPKKWEFIPTFGPVPRRSSVEATAARRKGTELPKAELWVTDLVVEPPRRELGSVPADSDDLEHYGGQILRAYGARVLGSHRLEVAENDAVEVDGALGDQRLTIRFFHRGRRLFELQCLARADGGQWPCGPAFASLEIEDLPPEPAAGKAPRVLHLRNKRFGFAFDAPDDSWLAIGPLEGGGGAQFVWIWHKGQRQIDVQVLDLSIAPGRPVDEALLARKLADAKRAKGDAVTIAESTLAGARCHHLEVDRADGSKQDMFILNHAGTNYSILVTEQVRDARFLDQVRKGFKLTKR